MRLLFIHGIGNEGSTKPDLLVKWRKILSDAGMAEAKLNALSPEMAYYGKALNDLKSAPEHSIDPKRERAFIRSVMREIARQNKISSAALTAAENEAFSGNEPAHQWLGKEIVGIRYALDLQQANSGAKVFALLRQIFNYFEKPGASAAIDAIVCDQFGQGDTVVVAHSLGTIIAYKLLTDFAAKGYNINVPLFITLGSPLALMKDRIKKPHVVPSNVASWVNYHDIKDLVTGLQGLNGNFAANIVDKIHDNTRPNQHGIEGYLGAPAIVSALTGLAG